MIFDLIIVGAGPAGLSAAVYAVRKKLNILVFGNDMKSQTNEAYLVNNYLGLPGISGNELAKKFEDHARALGAKIEAGAAVKKIERGADKNFLIKTSRGEFKSKAIIVATGKQYRKLDIPGAAEFDGKGISYCATCDAPLFKNKTVAIIGGGDAGQDAAWQLSKYATKAYLLNKYPELRGDDLRIKEKISNDPKIEILNSAMPIKIGGDKFVNALFFKQNDAEKEIAVQGVFVEIGSIPASDFLNGDVGINEKGEIIIDKNNMSSCAGIFAAGDVTDQPHKQLIIAAGEGAKAALSVYNYLKNINS